MKMHTAVFAVILSLFSFSTLAQGYGIYAGGSVGYADFHQNASQIQSILADAGIAGVSINASLDDKDTGWKLFGGYRFNEYLGLEAGYTNLGRVRLDLDATTTIPSLSASPVTLTSAATVKVDGFTVNGLVSYPVYDFFDVFAKGGVFFWSADTRASATVTGLGAPLSATFSDSESGTDLMFGVGARYRFNDYVTVRAEWERYNNLSSDNTDVDLFSAGLQFEF